VTPRGFHQARRAGKLLKSLIGNESVEFFVSPYTRALQTADALIYELTKDSAAPRSISIREDPRLREQDFGNLQRHEDIQRCRREREYCGAFYYRFPEGEAGTDVYNRIADFQDFLENAFDERFEQPPPNVVIVTHGMTLRLFLMRYFRWSVSTFHKLWNPINCQIVALERVSVDEELVETNEGRFPYSLLTPMRQDDIDPPDPEYTLRRLFTRPWGDPEGGLSFANIPLEQRQEWIKEQGMSWPKSASPGTSGVATLQRSMPKSFFSDEFFALPKQTFIDRARQELKKKLELIEEEKEKIATAEAKEKEAECHKPRELPPSPEGDESPQSPKHHRDNQPSRLFPHHRHHHQPAHSPRRHADASPVDSKFGSPVYPAISVDVPLPYVEQHQQPQQQQQPPTSNSSNNNNSQNQQ